MVLNSSSCNSSLYGNYRSSPKGLDIGIFDCFDPREQKFQASSLNSGKKANFTREEKGKAVQCTVLYLI